MAKSLHPVKAYAKVAIVSPDGKRALILRRGKTHPSKGGTWDIPGGYVNTDKGERAPTAARREATEEASVSLGPVIVTGVYTKLDTDHHGTAYCIGFLCVAQARSAQVRLSYEHDAFMWVGLADSEMLSQIKPKYRRLLVNALYASAEVS